MRKNLKIVVVASALVAGIAAAPALYAHDSKRSQGSMMGQGRMMGPGMMGQGGMMNMMGQMNEMMGTCNKMMQEMKKNHDAEKPKVQSPDTDSTK